MIDSVPDPTDDQLRNDIATLLADGLDTEVWPRAETAESINETIGRLQNEADSEVTRKLVIAGFTDHTIVVDGIDQACETCMYYLLHRKFCDLPELMLPVKPKWSCRLWRI